MSNLKIEIPYGTNGIHWDKDAMLFDLDGDTLKELIPFLTKELERALQV